MRSLARTLCSLVGAVLIAAAPCLAANADDILGVWFNQEKDSQIEIFRCGDQYCGKVVWLKEPDYPGDSREGTPGTPKLDHKNPDHDLRKVPIIGLRIMHGFHHDGKDEWSGGKVYDPKSGNTYRGKMTLVSPGELKLRGYIGISLFGRTDTWSR
jgi:uncharacterized protein (DUF2147 family)